MSEQSKLIDAMIAAADSLPARNEPPKFYVNRTVLAAMRATADGWRYFARLWWKWGRWPRVTRAIIAQYGGQREPHIVPQDVTWLSQ